ncbi:MAG: transglutaminase-like cysteine peptidase [Alphaproteobacteria bacterium]
MEATGFKPASLTDPKSKGTITAIKFLLPFALAFFATILFSTPAPASALQTANAAPNLTADFGVRQAMALDTSRLEKWTGALARHEAALNDDAECYNADAAFCFKTYWTELVSELSTLSGAEQLTRVNSEINRWSYRSDRAAWGRKDFWATPQEMFDKGAGDCEDMAIFKYLLLRAVGFDAEDMTLMVMATGTHAHMVLVVAQPGGAVVLDNLTNDILLASDDDRTDVPIYSLSEAGWQMLAVNKEG